jgi:hypothetical protein
MSNGKSWMFNHSFLCQLIKIDIPHLKLNEKGGINIASIIAFSFQNKYNKRALNEKEKTLTAC